MIVLVTGGRDYADKKKVYETLDSLGPITKIIHGAARGADSLANQYAEDRSIPCSKYPANWTKYGNAAGPIRNSEMLTLNPDIDLVVAFPGDRGTNDMKSKAKKKGITVKEVKD